LKAKEGDVIRFIVQRQTVGVYKEMEIEVTVEEKN